MRYCRAVDVIGPWGGLRLVLRTSGLYYCCDFRLGEFADLGLYLGSSVTYFNVSRGPGEGLVLVMARVGLNGL